MLTNAKIRMTLLRKFFLISAALVITAGIAVYLLLRLSLPQLDGEIRTSTLSADTRIERDAIGSAIIVADNVNDAAYALGFAHAQDRFFQMDLLRRSAAGELSALVGKVALELDKKNRFHQFRQRAKTILKNLSAEQTALLESYAKGVNHALSEQTLNSFEYLVTGQKAEQWLPEDSLLASFSMYVDLQGAQVERDWVLTIIEHKCGKQMVDFLHQASPFQAAIDGSQITHSNDEIPTLIVPEQSLNTGTLLVDDLPEALDIGSNNWAVSGMLTTTGSAMVSDDMHLSLRLPPIWYRAQLNYIANEQSIQITGVSLPGTPAIIVGASEHIAWGLTNANLDNVEWIALAPNTPTWIETESIAYPNGNTIMEFENSQYGPVKSLEGQKYALKWVAHETYAVNMNVAFMPAKNSASEALDWAKQVMIPVQNFVVADAQGNIAYSPMGAVSARKNHSYTAISEDAFSQQWHQQASDLPSIYNPEHGRVWSANARVVSSEADKRFGDGGYALGARGMQIRDRLFDQDKFSEQDFYRIQLDNEARFLMPWHALLVERLRDSEPTERYRSDIAILEDWQSCACPESIGYTLVRSFRVALINQLVAPLSQTLSAYDQSMKQALRGVEPAIWQLLEQQSMSWLPKAYTSYDELIIDTYQKTKQKLIKQYDADPDTLDKLHWGNVNALQVKHPFANILGFASAFLSMPEVPGFGDSYMPAVQRNTFGASQRLIAQPGNLQQAILTIPGGQSGHPLSKFFRRGFDEYANGDNTPLLPQASEHVLRLTAGN